MIQAAIGQSLLRPDPTCRSRSALEAGRVFPRRQYERAPWLAIARVWAQRAGHQARHPGPALAVTGQAARAPCPARLNLYRCRQDSLLFFALLRHAEQGDREPERRGPAPEFGRATTPAHRLP